MLRAAVFLAFICGLLLTQSCFVLEQALCDSDNCRLGDERCDGDDAIEVCVETTCGDGDGDALIRSWETVESCDDVCEERQSGVFCK